MRSKSTVIRIGNERHRATDCRSLTMHVPARGSDLEAGARRRSGSPFDPSSRVAQDVQSLVISLRDGDVLYATTAWGAYLFRKACLQGQLFHEKRWPLLFSYDRNCTEFYRMSVAAYEYGQSTQLVENTAALTVHYRLPYMHTRELRAHGVRDVIVVDTLEDLRLLESRFAGPSLPVSLPDTSAAALTLPGSSGETVLCPGDILAATRSGGLYTHFAVYMGDRRIIHYAAENGDFGGRISIHEAPLEEFQRGTQSIRVVQFPDSAVAAVRDQNSIAKYLPAESGLFQLARASNYRLYTPGETMARARSRLGESQYGLLNNNCEHFAVWCKTGVSESHQVNAWLTEALAIGTRALLRRAF